MHEQASGFESLSAARAATMRQLERDRRQREQLASQVAALLDHVAEMHENDDVPVVLIRSLLGCPYSTGDDER